MELLTIDVNNIIIPNDLSSLKELIQPIPETLHKLGLYLQVPKRIIDIINGIAKGSKRVMYLNKVDFTSSITGYAYVSYNSKKNICEIVRISGITLKQVMKHTVGVFPNDSLVWTGIPIEGDIEAKSRELCSVGFKDPHISKNTPSGKIFPSYILCMLKRNDNKDQQSSSIGEIRYVISEFEKKTGACEMQIALTPDAIRYLRDLQQIGVTMNKDGTMSQKEIAGNLVCNSVDSDLVHNLGIDYNSMIIGSEMGVPIAPGLYNFHSHHRQAYSRAKVKYGWPSAQDYVGFLMAFLEDNTILHLVTSIEGLYLLTMSEYSIENKEKLSKDIIPFIIENYNLCGSTKTPVEYTRYINNVVNEGNHLFVVQYIPWNNAHHTIYVSYKSRESNCFTRDNINTEYEALYQ